MFSASLLATPRHPGPFLLRIEVSLHRVFASGRRGAKKAADHPPDTARAARRFNSAPSPRDSFGMIGKRTICSGQREVACAPVRGQAWQKAPGLHGRCIAPSFIRDSVEEGGVGEERMVGDLSVGAVLDDGISTEDDGARERLFTRSERVQALFPVRKKNNKVGSVWRSWVIGHES
jgi:hypothetical protein